MLGRLAPNSVALRSLIGEELETEPGTPPAASRRQPAGARLFSRSSSKAESMDGNRKV